MAPRVFLRGGTRRYDDGSVSLQKAIGDRLARALRAPGHQDALAFEFTRVRSRFSCRHVVFLLSLVECVTGGRGCRLGNNLVAHPAENGPSNHARQQIVRESETRSTECSSNLYFISLPF